MSRIVKSWHARLDPEADLEIVVLGSKLKADHSPDDLIELYGKHISGLGKNDGRMRSAIWRALAKSCGSNLVVGAGALFRDIYTFEIGDHVFIGPQSYIQGRHDGSCVIGSRVWIGPQSFIDARDVFIGDYVGWGPGARLLGSQHTGMPANVPIITTDLEIKSVRIERGADIGTGAVILPGVVVGESAIVGAGAVVTQEVDPYAIVAGIPAKFLRWRPGHEKTTLDRKFL